MPIAGVFSDKFNRKILIIVVDSIQALVTFGGILFFQFDIMTVWLVLILMSIRSIFQTFHLPTVNAIVPTMVPLDKLTRINAISFLFIGVIQIFAQLIAALLLLLFPIHIILYIDIISFLIALVPLILIKIPSVRVKLDKTKGELKKNSFFKEFIVGIKTIRLIPGLVVMIIMAMLITFLMRPLTVLMPLYVYSVHSGGAAYFALTLISFQGGMVIGALITSIKKKWKNKVKVIFANLGIGMVGYIILALAPRGIWFIISIGAIIMGLTFPIINSDILNKNVFKNCINNEDFNKLLKVLKKKNDSLFFTLNQKKPVRIHPSIE